jgi:uncharacterized repeat protein (TIGR01451 family)
VLGNAIMLVAASEGNQPAWPTLWIFADTDPDESESNNDYRDVQYAYYYYDDDYLYFRLECFGSPNFTVEHESRYKWFIDTNDPYNMAWQGGNVYEAEFLLFVEDSPKPGGNGIGDVYLLHDDDGDGVISDDWPDYLSTPGPILDTSIVGYRIIDHCIDVYVRQAEIGNPIYSYFTWSTDKEDSNLDSTSTTDRSDSYWDENLSKADLSIVTSDNIDPISPGASLIYTLNVTNHGPHDAVNVNIKDILPDTVTFIDAVPAQNGITGQTVWWNLTSLAVGDSELITINVTIKDNTTSGVIRNFAVAYSGTYDPMPGNNVASEDTTVGLDTDGDGIPDCVDPDDDNDGYNDDVDAFPLDPSEWVDTDGDGVGDNADLDDDGDGYSDSDELTCGSDPLDAGSVPSDFDGDFIPDCVDTDDDNDGVPDDEDAFPYDSTESQDTDGDSIGDNADLDDDNDSWSDADEILYGTDPLDPSSHPSESIPASNPYTPPYDDPAEDENNASIANNTLGVGSLGIGNENNTCNASYNLLVTVFDSQTNVTTNKSIKIDTPNTPGVNIAEPGNVLFVLLSLLALMFLPLYFLLGKRRKDEEEDGKK